MTFTQVQTIGHSARGRPLIVRRVGSENAATRVFVIAGQHGDEPFAREAAATFLDEDIRQDIQVAVLGNANPDGSAANARRTAAGVDLNRDHQLLMAPETQAIHSFAREWRPHLVIDVHTYPPRRKHLLARGLVHCNDVFIDIANNPAACAGAEWADALYDSLPRWINTVCRQDFRCDRYTIVTKDGRVRHSTPDVRDARNGLALRLGVPTVLLEGREATRFDGPQAASRTVDALVAAARIILDSAADLPSNTSHIVELPIRSRYVKSETPCELEFLNLRSAQAHCVALDNPYYPRLKVTRRATLPHAYAVPRNSTSLIALLARHGLTSQPFSASRDNHLQYLVTPENARTLAVYLEPHSKYGLCRVAGTLRVPSAELR